MTRVKRSFNKLSCSHFYTIQILHNTWSIPFSFVTLLSRSVFIHATHTCQTVQFGVVKLSYSSWERGGEMVLWQIHVEDNSILSNPIYNRAQKIAELLKEEGLKGSGRWITKFLMLVKATCSLARCPGSRRRPRVTEKVKQLLRGKWGPMAIQLHAILLNGG